MRNLLIGLVFTGILSSCTQVEMLEMESNVSANLLADLQKVVENYDAGLKGYAETKVVKDETKPTQDVEGFADASIIKAYQNSINNVMAISDPYSTGKTKAGAVSYAYPIFPPAKYGVFKLNTCGGDRGFVYLMDCEDGGWTNVQGLVGETKIDANKNVEFNLCLVEPGYYGGGVLLLAPYNWSPSEGSVDIIRRMHDNEDSDTQNIIRNNGGLTVSGPENQIWNCFFGGNTVLTWMFSERKENSPGYSYAVLTNDFTTHDGSIHIDDENKKNINSATLWRHRASGTTDIRDLIHLERFRGIQHSENTVYYLKRYAN